MAVQMGAAPIFLILSARYRLLRRRRKRFAAAPCIVEPDVL